MRFIWAIIIFVITMLVGIIIPIYLLSFGIGIISIISSKIKGKSIDREDWLFTFAIFYIPYSEQRKYLEYTKSK